MFCHCSSNLQKTTNTLTLNGGEGKGCGNFLFSKVTLFEYNVSTILLPIVAWLLMIYEINHIWTAEMKWESRNGRRSERNLCNCIKKPEKNLGLQRGLNLWPHNYQCDALPTEQWCSTNWAGQLWVHMLPWKKWVLMIYEINHIWTVEMKWEWRNDRRSERNLCNCLKEAWKKFLCLLQLGDEGNWEST